MTVTYRPFAFANAQASVPSITPDIHGLGLAISRELTEA
jgi:hypothetical protein